MQRELALCLNLCYYGTVEPVIIGHPLLPSKSGLECGWPVVGLFIHISRVERRGLNPFSAMGDFRHPIVANLACLRVQELTYCVISWVKWEVCCGKGFDLIGGCRLNGLWGTSSPFCRHPPILASQEQLALRRLKCRKELCFWNHPNTIKWYLVTIKLPFFIWS